MPQESILRKEKVGLAHESIPNDLRHDGSARNAETLGITMNDRDGFDRTRSGNPQTVNQCQCRYAAKPPQRLKHRVLTGEINPDPVNLFGAYETDTDISNFDNCPVRCFPSQRRKALGIIDGNFKTGTIEDDSAGNHRPGQGAAAHFIDPGKKLGFFEMMPAADF